MLYSVRRFLISFRIIQVIHFILYVYCVTLAGFTPFPRVSSFGFDDRQIGLQLIDGKRFNAVKLYLEASRIYLLIAAIQNLKFEY